MGGDGFEENQSLPEASRFGESRERRLIMAEIEMEIDSVRIVLYKNEGCVNLKEKLGERWLSIYMSSSQAQTIGECKFDNIMPPKEAGFGVALSNIDLAESEIESAIINHFKDNTLFAKLVLTHHDKHYEVDCPPAIALIHAVRAESPIYVDEAVLDKASIDVPA